MHGRCSPGILDDLIELELIRFFALKAIVVKELRVQPPRLLGISGSSLWQTPPAAAIHEPLPSARSFTQRNAVVWELNSTAERHAAVDDCRCPAMTPLLTKRDLLNCSAGMISDSEVAFISN
jgi:hypothetical protein